MSRLQLIYNMATLANENLISQAINGYTKMTESLMNTMNDPNYIQKQQEQQTKQQRNRKDIVQEFCDTFHVPREKVEINYDGYIVSTIESKIDDEIVLKGIDILYKPTGDTISLQNMNLEAMKHYFPESYKQYIEPIVFENENKTLDMIFEQLNKEGYNVEFRNDNLTINGFNAMISNNQIFIESNKEYIAFASYELFHPETTVVNIELLNTLTDKEQDIEITE